MYKEFLQSIMDRMGRGLDSFNQKLIYWMMKVGTVEWFLESGWWVKLAMKSLGKKQPGNGLTKERRWIQHRNARASVAWLNEYAETAVLAVTMDLQKIVAFVKDNEEDNNCDTR